MIRLCQLVVVGAAAVTLSGCSSIGVGFTVPIGPIGVGIGVGGDGAVHGSVGVHHRGVGVGVGGSTRLPPPSAEPAASAPRP